MHRNSEETDMSRWSVITSRVGGGMLGVTEEGA